jgi:hypothetical protein
MENTMHRFNVSISSESKLRDRYVFTFEFKIASENNCRIKVNHCKIFDCDGYMYETGANDISAQDFIIGNSKYFSDSKRVNVYFPGLFKSRIGVSLVLTITDIDEKSKMNLCFQKKSAIRWDLVGVQPLEYEGVEEEVPEKETPEKETVRVEGRDEIREEVREDRKDREDVREESREQVHAHETLHKAAVNESIIKEETNNKEPLAYKAVDEIPKNLAGREDEEAFLEDMREHGTKSFAERTIGELIQKYDINHLTVKSLLSMFGYTSGRRNEAPASQGLTKEALSLMEAQIRAEIQKEFDSKLGALQQENKEKLEADLRTAIEEEVRDEYEERLSEALEAAKVVPVEPTVMATENNAENASDQSEAKALESYLNSIVVYDEKSAQTIGVELSNISIKVDQLSNKYYADLFSEVTYTKDTYVAVRNPIIKVIYYDKRDYIISMEMYKISKIETGHDVVDMELKPGMLKHWTNMGKIMVMVTI